MRGQGRCSEERGIFPTASLPREPVARHGSAARCSPRLPRTLRRPCSEAGCWRRCCARRCSRSARSPPKRPNGRRGPGPAASDLRSCWSSCTGAWRRACSAPSTTPCSPSRRAAITTPAARLGAGRPATRGSGSPSTCAAPLRGPTEFHMIPQDILNTFLKHTVSAKAVSWGSLVRRIFTSAAPLCTCQQSSSVARRRVLGAVTSTRKIMSLSQWAARVYLSKKKRLKV